MEGVTTCVMSYQDLLDLPDLPSLFQTRRSSTASSHLNSDSIKPEMFPSMSTAPDPIQARNQTVPRRRSSDLDGKLESELYRRSWDRNPTSDTDLTFSTQYSATEHANLFTRSKKQSRSQTQTFASLP